MLSFPTLCFSHHYDIIINSSLEEFYMPSALKKVRPDAKGRISLGAQAEGVSSYTMFNDHGRIILEPNIEMPAKEKWLWENEIALEKVKKGLKDSAESRIKSRGSFAKFVDDEE